MMLTAAATAQTLNGFDLCGALVRSRAGTHAFASIGSIGRRALSTNTEPSCRRRSRIGSPGSHSFRTPRFTSRGSLQSGRAALER
jgi:hypothetical protein